MPNFQLRNQNVGSRIPNSHILNSVRTKFDCQIPVNDLWDHSIIDIFKNQISFYAKFDFLIDFSLFFLTVIILLIQLITFAF